MGHTPTLKMGLLQCKTGGGFRLYSNTVEALEMNSYEFIHLLKAAIYFIKMRTSEIAQTAVLELLDSPKLISRKI